MGMGYICCSMARDTPNQKAFEATHSKTLSTLEDSGVKAQAVEYVDEPAIEINVMSVFMSGETSLEEVKKFLVRRGLSEEETALGGKYVYWFDDRR